MNMGPHDCFYRFRRDLTDASTIVYVHVKNLDIIPQQCQTYGPDVINVLEKNVGGWDQQWTTLEVCSDANGEIVGLPNTWQPHSLPPQLTVDDLPHLNVLGLEILSQFKSRVFEIRLNGQQQILKICPFAFQIKSMEKEIRAYHMLAAKRCNLIPRITSYVFERSQDQVIGFTCTKFQGRFAELVDYTKCKRSLTELHSCGVVHGDINKYNIIITSDGPRFFDLEESVFDTEDSEDNLSSLQQRELDGLERALSDQDGLGRPWSK
jgi:hypothetical protein